VDQLTPKEVEERNKKFSWRKTKPSDQMRFEADNSGVVHHRHLHYRDKRLLFASVIGNVIHLSDHRLFPIVGQCGGGLICHLHNGLTGGGRSQQDITLTSRMGLSLIDNSLTSDVVIRSVSLAIE
jgi:hypothetical protein